jgi:predicted nucleic acid-binding protein
MILADTSAWVEYDRATGSAVHRRLAELIASAGPLSVTEPVIMEVLAGARTKQQAVDLRRLLLRFSLLRFDAASDFDAAARIYRRCRVAGVTPRGMVGCMIAAVAWRRGAVLLAHDVELQRVGQVMGIDLDQASPPKSADASTASRSRSSSRRRGSRR